MRHLKILTFLSFSFCVMASCDKKDQTVCTGGNGGNITLVVHPKHHGKPVKPTNAYIKYNNKDAPSSLSDYDLTVTADTSAISMKLTNLKCGDYYIFATGYDTAISKAVKGGIPYTVSESASGEINIDIPATE